MLVALLGPIEGLMLVSGIAVYIGLTAWRSKLRRDVDTSSSVPIMMMLTRKRVGRLDGALLIGIYAAYMIWLLADGKDLARSVG